MKLISVCGLLALVLSVGAQVATAEEGVTAAAAFDQLKSLAGDWNGAAAGSGNAEAEEESGKDVVHEFRVSAAGTVIMETMSPGTENEMINMYHVDGDDLLMIHYCAGGNQPHMKLARAESTAENLIFDFDGGTNLESADHHIHDAALRWNDDGTLRSAWNAYSGEEKVGEMVFTLERSDG